MDKLKVLFCGYREWANEATYVVMNHPWVAINAQYIQSKEAFDKLMQESPNFDTIIFVGWSWIVPKSILDKYLCLCVHPSDLPAYRGGTPLQHQIIDGVKNTKVSLLKMTEKIDAGPIYCKEDLSLEGDLETVLDNLKEATIHLLMKYFLESKDKPPVEQDNDLATTYKRRKPEQSEITAGDLEWATAEEIYNKIRALQYPYPNAYIVCGDGTKVYITKAHF